LKVVPVSVRVIWCFAGIQQSSGLVGVGSANLRDGSRLSSVLCWSAHTDIWEDCIWQGTTAYLPAPK